MKNAVNERLVEVAAETTDAGIVVEYSCDIMSCKLYYLYAFFDF